VFMNIEFLMGRCRPGMKMISPVRAGVLLV